MARKQEQKNKLRRIVTIGVMFVVFSSILLVRLGYVQAVNSSEHLSRAAKQSVRRIRLNPVRGRIFSRDGAILVDNRPSYDVIFHVGEMRQPGKRSRTIDHIVGTAAALADQLGRTPPLDAESVHTHLNHYPALPLTVFTRLSEREHAVVAEWMPPVPGMEVQDNFARAYPYGSVGTHILGFTGRVKPTEKVKSGEYSYVTSELQGKDGLEKVYNSVMAGKAGMKLVRVDTLGYVHEQIGETEPPVDGWNLVLAIDRRAQQIADEELAGHQGAMVVLDVRTGGVVAMASAPTYNLNELSAALYSDLATDTQGRPLINRAVSDGFIPGSIVKPIIALAALKAGMIDPEKTEVICTGRYPLASIRCWLRSGHGSLSLTSAIEQSCNSYFIDIGLKTGLDNIRPMMLAAGFGRRPRIDLPYAGDGFVPSRTWALQNRDYGWIASDTAYLSIGQGAIGVSPLQAAMFVAAIANGGTVFEPYLVQEIQDVQGSTRKVTVPKAVSRLPVSQENLQWIRQGMFQVVNGDHATARRAQNSAFTLAGKTGTAEVKSGDDDYNNAWFIAYGPFENPRYAVAIVIERGASGGRTAAPIAGRFFDRWLGTGQVAQTDR